MAQSTFAPPSTLDTSPADRQSCSPYKTLLLETLKGKSLYRSLSNLSCQRIQLSGKGLDLGAEAGASSYLRFFSLASGTQITFTDLHPKSPEVLRVDLESKIAVEDSSQQFLILMNVLEHLYHFDYCLSECQRILCSSGQLVGAVPFLHRIHLAPDDHFRFTESTLKRKFQDLGFAKVTITPLGFGPLSAAATQCSHLLRFTHLIGAFLLLSVFADTVLNRLFGTHAGIRSSNFPLGYFFHAVK